MDRGVVESIHHVALIVRSIEQALPYYVEQLCLPVVDDRRLPDVGARLVFLDAGNALIQLVEPTHAGPLRDHLEQYGEGLHHVCFEVGDVQATLQRLAPGSDVAIGVGSGGRRVAFIPSPPHGLRAELIETEPVADRSGG